MDTSRFIAVDDTDPLIQYEGPSWFLDDTGSQDKKGNFGPVYNRTLHGTKVNASLSFAFNGSKFGIIGTNNIRNDSGVLDPAWECFVDGTKVESRPFAFFENNWRLCGHQPLTLDDGPHTVTLNVSVRGSVPFYFDKIEYTPSVGVDLDNKTVYVPGSDPAVKFGAGWGPMGDTANATMQTGSLLTFDFYGVSVSWYGFIPRSTHSSSGTYAIDGNSPSVFTMNAHPEGATQYNMEYFRTPDYPKGQHSLIVSYIGGPSGAAPLLLDYFVVRNTTKAVKDPNVTGTTIGVSNKSSRGRNHNIGAIVGGVLGGLAMLFLAVLIFLYIQRRSKRRSAAKLHASYADDGTIVSTNIPVTPPFGRDIKSSARLNTPAPQVAVSSKFGPRSLSPLSTDHQLRDQDFETSYYHGRMGSTILHQPQPQYLTTSNIRSTETHDASTTPLLDAGHAGELSGEPNHDPSHPAQLLNTPLVLIHQDSGLRIGPGGSREIPPTYTMR